MKTNKERALSKLNNYIIDYGQSVEEDQDTLNSFIELASKPDWYYPSKGEFPKKGDIIISYLDVMFKVLEEGKLLNCHNGGLTHINRQESWTYLPKFIEDDK